MTSIATYLIWAAVLSGYRSSKHWPKGWPDFSWLKNPLLTYGSALLGSALFVLESGWTVGILMTFCMYTVILSCVLFFANCRRSVQIAFVTIFHLLCLAGLIFTL